MQTITTYSFSELPQNIQEKVLDEQRNWIVESYNWWEDVYNDIKEIGKILGFEITDIYLSGFWSQDDGACFEGDYKYKKNSTKLIRKYAPEDKELHDIADTLQAIQKRNFYSLCASSKQRGHYSHSSSTHIYIWDIRDRKRISDDKELIKTLRDFMDWGYKKLEAEYNYLTSDTSVKENFEINEIQFTVDGRIAQK